MLDIFLPLPSFYPSALDLLKHTLQTHCGPDTRGLLGQILELLLGFRGATVSPECGAVTYSRYSTSGVNLTVDNSALTIDQRVWI